MLESDQKNYFQFKNITCRKSEQQSESKYENDKLTCKENLEYHYEMKEKLLLLK